MLAYKLNQQIDGNKLLQTIQKYISKNVKNDKEYLLVIKIQEISYSSDEHIAKLEYKNLDN